MSDPVEIPAAIDGGHGIEPPIVDSLERDSQQNSWAIVFIPEDSVSTREKEIATVPFNSQEGKRITLRMNRLDRLLGAGIVRLCHCGGCNFTFHLEGGSVTELAEAHGQGELSMRAYIELADIAMSAQLVFLEAHSVAT